MEMLCFIVSLVKNSSLEAALQRLCTTSNRIQVAISAYRSCPNSQEKHFLHNNVPTCSSRSLRRASFHASSNSIHSADMQIDLSKWAEKWRSSEVALEAAEKRDSKIFFALAKDVIKSTGTGDHYLSRDSS